MLWHYYSIMPSEKPHVLTVTPNPAIDQTLTIDNFIAGGVNRVRTSQSHAGGKGVNVAAVLAALGAQVRVTGWLGQANAGPFETLFKSKSIDDQFIRVPGETRIGLKISDTVTSETTDINFPGLAISPAAGVALLAAIERLVSPGVWMVLAGSLPQGVDPQRVGSWIETARARGGRIALDTSGPALRVGLDHAPDLIKPNVEELTAAIGEPIQTEPQIVAAARVLLGRGVKVVAVSMGGDGAIFVDQHQALRTRPPKVDVQSTVGAGDAMVAGLVDGLASGMTLVEIARRATALGTDAVTRAGRDAPLQFEQYLDAVTVEPIG